MQRWWKSIPKNILFSCVLLSSGCGGEGGSQNINNMDTSNPIVEQEGIIHSDKAKDSSYSFSGTAVKGPLAFAAVYAYQFDNSKPNYFDDKAPLASTITDANGEFKNLKISARFKPPFIVVINAESAIDTNTGKAPVLSQLMNVVTSEMVTAKMPVYATPLTTIAFHMATQASGSGTVNGFLTELKEAGIQVRETFGLGMSPSIDILTMTPVLSAKTVALTQQQEVAEYRAASEALATVAYNMSQNANGSEINADEILKRLASDLGSDGSINSSANGLDIDGIDVSAFQQDISSLKIANTNIAVNEIATLLAEEAARSGMGMSIISDNITLDLAPVAAGNNEPSTAGAIEENTIADDGDFPSTFISMDPIAESDSALASEDSSLPSYSNDTISDSGIIDDDPVTVPATEYGSPESDLLLSSEIVTTSRIIIPRSAQWKFLDNGTYPGSTWTSLSFNDSRWKIGNAELGYGDGDEKTKISFGRNSSTKYITTYFRKKFSVADLSKIGGLRLKLLRDDGAVVYLNGKEVVRSNMPSGTITKDTKASSTILNEAEKTFYTYSVSSALLKAGDNMLAVELHQHSSNNIDVSFNLELENVAGTPVISPEGGNYTSAVDVTIKSNMAGAEIRYTTDDSEPTLKSSLYATPLRFTQSTTLKAKAFYRELAASDTATGKFTVTSSKAIAPASVIPANGAKEIVTNETITARFSNVKDVVVSKFTLRASGNNIDGAITIKDGNVFFVPNAPLAYNQIYTAKIMASMQSASTGELLAADYSWTFTTINPKADWIVFYNDLNNDYPHVYTDQDLRDKWNFNYGRSAGIAQGRVSVVNGDTPNQSHVLQVRYEAGTYGLAKNGVQWRTDLGKHDELYMAYWIKFKEGFNFVRGGKIPGLVGGATTSGVKPNGTDFFIARMMFIPLGKVIQYVYHLDQANIHGDGLSWNYNNKPQKQFIPGKWHRIENHIRMNTPGKANGVIETWFDGDLALRKTNFRFRTVDTLKIDQFFFSTFFGGSDSTWATKKREYMYMDNIIVSKKPIAH